MKISAVVAVVAAAMLASCSTRPHVSQLQGTPVAQTMRRQVLNALDAGDGDALMRSLRSQLIADPANLTVRLELADRYWKAGIAELAIEHYRIAAERFPDNPKIAMLLARALRDFNHSEQAIATLAAFCKTNPLPPADLLSLFGILQDDAGQFAAAEKVYRAALEQSPARADLRNNLGYNLLLQGRPKEAAAQFAEALKIEPRSQVANNNLGLAILAEWKDDSQPAEALLRWQSVSGPASAHNNLATVLIGQRRYAAARQELEIALGYRKDFAPAIANLELISELDGGRKGLVRPARNAFWKRVKTVFTASASLN